MGAGAKAAAALGLVLLAAAPGAARDVPRKIALVRTLDVSEPPAPREFDELPRIGFDGEGGLVVFFTNWRDGHDAALAWRRIAPDGVLSPTTRIELPPESFVDKQDMVVADDGTATLTYLRAHTDPSDGAYVQDATEIVRVSKDGVAAAPLSLDAPASHLRMSAHDGVVDVAYAAKLGAPNDLAVYWRRIGADGRFAGDPVRLSLPADPTGDPLRRVGIWDLFFGVDRSGTGRVVYRRTTFWTDLDTGTAVPLDPPEIYWHYVDRSGHASPPISLGESQDKLKAAFAPDGSTCVARYQDDGGEYRTGTSFPQPIVVAPDGSFPPFARPKLPRFVTYYPGEQFAIGADAGSRFRLGLFASGAGRWRRGRPVGRPMRPAHYVSSFDTEGDTSGLARTALPMKRYRWGDLRLRYPVPRFAWNYVVAADGTSAVVGTTEVGSFPTSDWVSDVAVRFTSPTGRPAGDVVFTEPSTPGAPVLATKTIDGRTLFAAAWTGKPADYVSPRPVVVAFFE